MKALIYGRTNCGFCTRAIQLCENYGIEFEYIDIREAGISKEQLSEKMGCPVKTVPQIIVDGDRVGGHTEFVAYVSKNHRQV